MRKAFTLIEMLVVVIIIGILAALALPQYLGTIEKSKLGKAKNSLALLSRAEKMYFGENSTYTTSITNLDRYLETDEITRDTDWTYTIPTGTATDFRITATRVGSSSENKISLNRNGSWCGDFKYAAGLSACS